MKKGFIYATMEYNSDGEELKHNGCVKIGVGKSIDSIRRFREHHNKGSKSTINMRFIYDVECEDIDTIESKVHNRLKSMGYFVVYRKSYFGEIAVKSKTEVYSGVNKYNGEELSLDIIKNIIEDECGDPDLHKKEIILKPHQEDAVNHVIKCFDSYDKRCLWFHKARSGKTYCTAGLIRNKNYKNVLIVTSFPILNYQWKEVFLNHKGFSNTDIIVGSDSDKIELNSSKNSIILVSLQDIKGGDEVFSKDKFESIKNINFDLLVIDEVHYGVETQKTQEFLNKVKYERLLGLSATPTKNLICGRFTKEQTHTYTLVDEYRMKSELPDLYPYSDINFLMWNLSDSEKSNLKYFSDEEQFKFDKFFRIEGDNFYYKSDIIYLFKKLSGDIDICRRDKIGTSYPFNNNRKFSDVKSILLFLPNIQSQYKLKEILDELESYDDFEIHVTNSKENSSKKLIEKINSDFKSSDKRSLILAVDQLTTGITLDDCDMVCMMNDWKSVDTYVQASFRPQSPRKNKLNCWVIDFNPARSFELMWEYQNITSRYNGKSLTENISEWVECVNIFNRVDGEFIEVDVDGFVKEYNNSVLFKTRFNYQSVILQDKLIKVKEALIKVGISGGSSSSDEDLNDDGISKGKSKKTNKNNDKKDKTEKDKTISREKLMEIAKALVDKTMLLPIFTYFKHDNIDDCFESLKNDNTKANGFSKLTREMYLETLLLGMDNVDDVDLDVIKLIYDNVYNKDIINKKIYLFNQNVNLIYNSIGENPEIISDMLKNTIELIDSYLKPSNTEKKILGEVFTSLKLVEEMLDKLPKEVWSNPHLKWLDPANGIGNFPVIIVKNLMDGLKDWQPDSELRLKHILENMIYVCELQSKNMFIYLQLFDPDNKYKMNFYRGSFLDSGFDKHMKEVWGLDNFDIGVGNPPFQWKRENEKKSHPLWDKFVIKGLDILSKNGYLVMVHPSGWRNVDGVFKKVQLEFRNRDILYLNMNTSVDGIKIFNADTNFDFYCIRNTFNRDIKTNIIDINNDGIIFNLKNKEFIPNSNLDEIYSLVAKDGEERVEILYSRSAYGTDKKHMSKEQTEKFKYPCVYSVKKGGVPTFFYSSVNDKGHFGIPKLILGNGANPTYFFDEVGEYGLTQFSYGIVDNIENLKKIEVFLLSNKVKEITISTKFLATNGNPIIYPKIISLFKKDFWKEFI